MVAAARRTSPGLMPSTLALARSTSTSMVGSVGGEAMCALTTPSVPSTVFRTSSAVFCSVSRLSFPKTRTVIWSFVGLSTSVIRFFV